MTGARVPEWVQGYREAVAQRIYDENKQWVLAACRPAAGRDKRILVGCAFELIGEVANDEFRSHLTHDDYLAVMEIVHQLIYDGV